MTTLFLQALDVWLFRDGKPFEAGGDHRAESLFPPYPSVIQGALRSHYLVHRGVDLRDREAIEQVVGTSEDYKSLRLRGPFLAKRETQHYQRLMALPANVVATAKGYQWLWPVARKATTKSSADRHLPMRLEPAEAGKYSYGQWLNQAEFDSAWASKTFTGRSEAEFFQREPRPGIGMDMKRRTTREGLLYEVEFIRPDETVGLMVELEGYPDWPARGLLSLGGERHAASFETIACPAWPVPPDPLPAKFALYFATPTFFQNGWHADWTKFFEGQVKLQCAAFHRYQSVGGFDWAKPPTDASAHKPARRYVPAGAVYFFTCEAGPARFKTDLVQRAITDTGAEIGFGQVLVKEWK